MFPSTHPAVAEQDPPSETTLRDREQKLAYKLIAFPLLLILLIIIVPVLWNFWLSLKSISVGELGTDALLFSETTLSNFRRIFTSSRFWGGLIITLVYTFLGVGCSLLFGLFGALLLNQSFRGRALLRGLYLFPYVAPIVAVAYVSWTWMLEPASGVVSWGLQTVGLAEGPIGFLTEKPYALITVILFQTWRYGPFCMLFILATLQSIPESLYDAARVDGATPVQQFFLVTLPEIRGVLATLFLLRFMWVFNKFDDVYLLTKGAGGTEILPIYLYNVFDGQQDLGMAAAVSVVLFAILGLFLFVYFRYVLEEW